MTDDPSLHSWFIDEVNLTRGGGLSALVYGHLDLDPNVDLSQDLSPLMDILDFAAEALPLDDEVDTGDEHIRGPYDLPQLNVFFRDSGLRDVVTVYYDEDANDYYVFINTD